MIIVRRKESWICLPSNISIQKDSFTCRVAKTLDEIKQFIEAGFEYVMEKDGLVYFRKRK